jgi:ribonuclease HI
MLLHIHHALVRSHLTYGSECFFSAPKTTLKKLETAEMRSLKCILNLPKSTHNAAVYALAELTPLDLTRKQQCALYAIKIHETTNNAATHYHLESQQPRNSPRTLQTLPELTHKVFSSNQINPSNIATTSLTLRPSWTLSQPTIILNIPNLTKNDNPHTQKLTSTEYLLTKYPHSILVYTDGSVLEDGRVGGGFYIPALKKKTYFHTNNGLCVCSAELVAILLALQHLLTLPMQLYRVVICTDSQAALKTINSSHLSYRSDIIADIKFSIHQLLTLGIDTILQWVPAHVGIHGNEMADKLAKAGAAAAPGSLILHLQPSFKELKTQVLKIFKNLCTKRNSKLHKKYPLTAAYYNNKPSIINIWPPVHPIIHRLYTNSWRTKWSNPICLCGENFTPSHALLECYCFDAECAQLRSNFPSEKSIPKLLQNANHHTLLQITNTIRNTSLEPMI